MMNSFSPIEFLWFDSGAGDDGISIPPQGIVFAAVTLTLPAPVTSYGMETHSLLV